MHNIAISEGTGKANVLLIHLNLFVDYIPAQRNVTQPPHNISLSHNQVSQTMGCCLTYELCIYTSGTYVVIKNTLWPHCLRFVLLFLLPNFYHEQFIARQGEGKYLQTYSNLNLLLTSVEDMDVLL